MQKSVHYHHTRYSHYASLEVLHLQSCFAMRTHLLHGFLDLHPPAGVWGESVAKHHGTYGHGHFPGTDVRETSSEFRQLLSDW